MASKIKVDQIQTGDGTGTIALQNQLSGMTTASLPALGSAQMPTGSVLQVVEASYATEVGTSSSSYVDIGLSASITPISTSSKIFITAGVSIMVYNNSAADAQGVYQLLRDSTEISTKLVRLYDYGNSGTMLCVPSYIGKLDSPSTTSAVIYKIRMMLVEGSQVRAQFDGFPSQIVLMEIAG